ncbi:hypothetical protein C8Q80DRAFT_1264329 [Daedaleopsis nitida]|nr:hypothetical protein C8Q80DRAFT_1264329 [Daedaleopsis nitida]
MLLVPPPPRAHALPRPTSSSSSIAGRRPYLFLILDALDAFPQHPSDPTRPLRCLQIPHNICPPMAAGVMTVNAYSRKPLPSFDYPYPYLSHKTLDGAPIVSHNNAYAYSHTNDSDNVPHAFVQTASDSLPATAPVAHEPSSANALAQRAPAMGSHHSFHITAAVPRPDGRGNAQNTAFPADTPPPVPPKPPVHARPKSVKSVSIVAPTDISPSRRAYTHSVSESGHSYHTYTTATNTAVASSESVPARPTILTSPHSMARGSLAASLSSNAVLANPSSMEPVTSSPSSARARRNRLHKVRPRSSSPDPVHTSVLGLLLTRAFGSGEAVARHHRSSSSPSMGDRSYRPTRSFSDGGSKVPLSRPSPSSRGSANTDSSYTPSSSASTSFSYASTSLTTPDSTSFPGLSPRNSTRTNKLQKKRPSVAPSSYQNPYGAALGRSKSTPNGLGQRSPRHRIWTSVDEARQAAEEADSTGAQDPSMWHASTEPLPSRRSTLGPIFEVRRRTSSQALSDLACTGLCSTSIAARSSQLALDADCAERTHSFHNQSWDNTDSFNPYVECVSAPPYSRDSHPGTHTFPLSNPSSSSSDSSGNAGESSSGFAVVTGYLDRSEDAMRRWTLAMADVPDEVLLQHLERLRKESMALSRGRVPGRRSAAPSQIGHGDDDITMDTRSRRSSFFFGGPREMGVSPRSPSRACFSVGHYDRDLDGDDSDDEGLSDEEEDEEDWKTARQVLFRCRELVQTERNYQSRLRELASTELAHRYASLVSKHVPALLRVSETLLAHVIDDPSAWGVSAAFIGCEDELEAAFLTKKSPDEVHPTQGLESLPVQGRVKRTRSHVAMPSLSVASRRRFSSAMSDIGHGSSYASVRPASPGMFTAALGTGLPYGLAPSPSQLDVDAPAKSPQSKSAHGHGGLSRVSTISSGLGRAWKRMSMPASMNNIPSLVSPPPTHSATQHTFGQHSASSAHGHGNPKKSEHDSKMTVRDLAIQPTQRVMRYVLQYRDLLDHTPATSPSRALVERAYEIALRIAKKCDRAQAHAGFLRQSGSTPKSDKHTPRIPSMNA